MAGQGEDLGEEKIGEMEEELQERSKLQVQTQEGRGGLSETAKHLKVEVRMRTFGTRRMEGEDLGG